MQATEISVRRRERAYRTVVASGWGTGYFPVVERLDDGTLAAIIRGGAEHMGGGGRLDIVRSRDGGSRWTKPVTVFDTPSDDRNPAFGQAANGTLILGFIIVTGYQMGYIPHGGTPDYKFYDYLVDVWIPSQSKTSSHYILSTDRGRTWSERKRLDVPGYSVSPFGRIIRLEDDTLLMNVYGSKLGARKEVDSPGPPSHSFAIRSSDNGETWGRPALIAKGMNETSFLSLGGNSLLAVLRSDEPEEATYASSSSDAGMTWTKPRRVTGLLEHPADLARLKDGRVLMVYGHRRFPFGIRGLVSEDGGVTWNHDEEIVFSEDAENQDCGYPSVVRLPDGRVLILYYQLKSHLHPEMPAHCNAIRFSEKAL